MKKQRVQARSANRPFLQHSKRQRIRKKISQEINAKRLVEI
jgi:hypothetical protein